MNKKKALLERRNALLDRFDVIMLTLETTDDDTQTRALTTDEQTEIDTIETEIRNLDRTIAAIETQEERARRDSAPADDATDPAAAEQAADDEKRFLDYVRGIDTRALDVSSNNAIIPETIANRIIEEVKELSTIYNMVTVFNIGGDLVFPIYDETNSSVFAAYVEDLEQLIEGTGKFVSATLRNHIVGSLAIISRSLINRTDFDLLSYLVYRVAKTILEFLEREIIVGTANKLEGLITAKVRVTSASATAITADDLIDLQMSIPEVYQGKACWFMHKKTLGKLRKLKDNDGQYLLNRDITGAFGWSILGKQVYITDSMPEAVSGETPIVYGDMTGYYLKFAQGIEIQILNELYATRHGIGVVGYVECDGKIIEPQKLGALQMA